MPREITRRSLFGLWTAPLRGAPQAAVVAPTGERRSVTRRVTVRHELCAATAGADCRLCLTVCDRGAVSFDDVNGPAISRAACDACGACVEVCLTSTYPAAIRIVEAPS